MINEETSQKKPTYQYHREKLHERKNWKKRDNAIYYKKR